MATNVPAVQEEETRLKMSYEEFLAWADEDTHAEWVAGEVIVFMPPTYIHQAVVGFLHVLLRAYVDLSGLGRLLIAPFEMRVTLGGSAREPDILFIARENLHRLTEKRLKGPADLIIEVISPDSVRRDRQEKFREYAAAGVREYWVLDPRPDKQRADFYRLDEAGEYDLFATEDNEQVFSAVVEGFWLRPAWLWQADTLSPLLCALELEQVATALAKRVQPAGDDAPPDPER